MFSKEQSKTTYARILKNEQSGKLEISVYRGKNSSGEPQYESFSSFTGYFRGITYRPAPKDRSDLRNSFQLHFEGADGQSVTFEVAEDSGYGHKLIAALGGAKASTLCKVQPYLSENEKNPSRPYWNVSVRDVTAGDNKDAPFVPYCIDFKTDLPPVEKVMYKGKEMIDNTARVVYFKALAEGIDQNIKRLVAAGSRPSFMTQKEHNERFKTEEDRPDTGHALYAAPSTAVPRTGAFAESDDDLPF